MCFMFVRYEPELSPAALYTIREPKATVKVFSTGKITVLGTEHTHLDVSVMSSFILNMLVILTLFLPFQDQAWRMWPMPSDMSTRCCTSVADPGEPHRNE